MRLSKRQQEFLKESVQVLDLPARVVNGLEARKGVLYVHQLLQLTEDELEHIPNFGKKTVKMIFKSLAENGFKRASNINQ
jgi:DNA-directed RNA polymerase alpha subunit